MLECLEITYANKGILSNKDIKFINKLSPKILRTDGIILTVQNINAIALLNYTNIDVELGYQSYTNSYLWFINTPVQLFDTNSSQRLIIEWQSIKFFIKKNLIKNVKLFKSNNANFLFIPLDIIYRILYSGFKKVFNVDNINKQFVDLGDKHQFNTDGFIVPMRYSDRVFVNLADYGLNFLNQIKDIRKIFNEKHIELTIAYLWNLLQINRLLTDNLSCINFRYIDNDSTEMSEYLRWKITDNPNWINLKFWEISISCMLSPDEFQFWWKMLHSVKTRFNLNSIELKLKFLSECLTVLSLCSDCPELECIELKYWEADTENENEAVEQAEREFRHKFGFIPELHTV